MTQKWMFKPSVDDSYDIKGSYKVLNQWLTTAMTQKKVVEPWVENIYDAKVNV